MIMLKIKYFFIKIKNVAACFIKPHSNNISYYLKNFVQWIKSVYQKIQIKITLGFRWFLKITPILTAIINLIVALIKLLAAFKPYLPIVLRILHLFFILISTVGAENV